MLYQINKFFILIFITGIKKNNRSSMNFNNLANRQLDESTPLLEGEGAGGEVTNDTPRR